MSPPSKFALGSRRVLLTGGGGFVGGVLAPALASATPGARRVMLRRPGGAEGRAHWATRDAEIYDCDALGAIVEELEPDLVIHLAAQSSVAASRGSAEETWRVNFEGSFALAKACARAAPTATFLFASSSEVYGASFRDGPVDEDSPLRPGNAYARSKAAAEQMLGDVLAPTNRLIVARAFNHTGAGQDERFVLASFAAQIARIEAGLQSPEIHVGNLDFARDFLDVHDVCDAYLRLIEAAPRLPARAVFNVSSGAARPIRDILEWMRGKALRDFDVRVDPTRLRAFDIPSAVGSSVRLRDAVDWTPTRSLEDTLTLLLEHAREACSVRS